MAVIVAPFVMLDRAWCHLCSWRGALIADRATPPTEPAGAAGRRDDDRSNFNLSNIPIAGGPTIEFAFTGDVCTAEFAGAKLRAERLDDEHADLRLHDVAGKVLASVVVSKLWDDESITVSVMNIGSALLWSHARWVAAQAGGGAATRGIVGPAFALEWYDGPLLEIARVDFGDRAPHEFCVVHGRRRAAQIARIEAKTRWPITDRRAHPCCSHPRRCSATRSSRR